jgi:hypothetical protein
MTTHWLSRFAAATMLIALAGCAMPNVFKLSKDTAPKEGPRNPVIRILGMWQAADGMAMNKSSRGFAGQLLFFSQGSDLAVQVDGDVQIYVFDDQGTPDEQATPFQQCRYVDGAWSAHMGQGPLGATYSVFVPYTRTGFHEAKCALRIRYTPKDGQPVYSEMVNVVLPGGKRKDKPAADSSDAPDVNGPEGQKDSGEPLDEAVSSRKPPYARGTSTTIPTSQAIQEQLQAQHKVPAVKLNATERRRIMREASIKDDWGKDDRENNDRGNNASRVVQASHEESESEIVAGNEADAEQDVQVEQEMVEESLAADGDDDSPAPVKPAKKPAAKRVLDDDE